MGHYSSRHSLIGNLNRCSNEAKDCLLRMLTYDSNKRPTAKELLSHPFFGRFSLNYCPRIIFKEKVPKEPHHLLKYKEEVGSFATERGNNKEIEGKKPSNVDHVC